MQHTPADLARRWAARLAETTGVELPAEELEPILLGLAEEAQAEGQEARDAAARRFIDLYAATPVGVALGDADGLIRDVNPALEQLLGHPRAELIGQPLTQLGATPADATALAAALETAQLPGRRPRRERLTVAHAEDGPLRAHITITTVAGEVPGVVHPVLMLEDITDLDLLGETLRRQNVQDSLTGLPNSYHFENKLDTVLAAPAGDQIALIYLDIDGFKVINDGLGPGAGDEVLRQVARTLEAQFGSDDAVVARLSGDGFAVLLRGDLDTADVVAHVEDTMRELTEPVYVDGKGVGINVSVGIVVTDATTHTREELHRAAEITLHRAKENGRAQWMLFEQELHDRDRRRYSIGAAIGGGLENGQFGVDYEPTVTLNGKARIAVVNAVLRWDHPEHGVLRSTEFGAVADTTGMTPALGQQLLTQSVADAAEWHREFPNAPDLCVHLPTRFALDPNLVGLVRAELARTGLPPQKLRICTDSIALTDPRGELLETLSVLAELEVKITLAVSGAADLELIPQHHLPVGFVIVSGTLVDALADAETAHGARTHLASLLKRAGELGIARIGADGVVDAAHARELAELGIFAGRGKMFGEEADATTIRAMLAEAAARMPD